MNPFLSKMDCCVCLENKKPDFKCHTCSAMVCDGCQHKRIMLNVVDQHVYYMDAEEVKDILKCPCCRVINWRELYDTVLHYMIDISECGENQHQIPSIRYLMRNIDERYGHEFEVDPFDEDESRADRRHLWSKFEARLRYERDFRPFKRNMTIRLKKYFQMLIPGENVEIVLIDPESDTDEN